MHSKTRPDTGRAAAPGIGPAATIELSQKALAMINGDKDWKPGQKIDSY